MTRAAPGTQLSVGRLRVDAAKAIAKLREYQLADRTAWILEAIRAAVASGATALTLKGDANDVWLAWDGPAWPAGELPTLFDELVSPEPASERHHVRLLAAAVNSALGLVPAYVDVWTIADREARRARFTPDVLDESTALGEASALRKIVAEAATPPAGIAPAAGMLVHLRRRAALGMITYLFWEREPPELAIARASCGDIAVPLDIQRERYHRDPSVQTSPRDLVRVPLGEGLDGFAAIRDPAARRVHAIAGGHCEVAERGVLLAAHDIALGLPIAHEPFPLRVFVDAPRMPTNASRSQVRRDHHPLPAAERRAPHAVAAAIDELVAILASDAATERHREAALQLVAPAVGPSWNVDLDLLSTMKAFGKLLALPLLRDAVGKPRPIGHTWIDAVHTGKQPLDPVLERWVSNLLWLPPGDAAWCLVRRASLDGKLTRQYVKRARRQARAHHRFFLHAPSAARLDPREPWRLRMPLGGELEVTCVPQHVFAGIAGELCLQPDRFVGDLIVMLEGRELDRMRVDTPIGFTATVTTSGLVPSDGYRGVERDARLDAVIRVVKHAVVRAGEALALALAGQRPEHVELPRAADAAVDAERIRRTIGLALELGLPVQAPLSTAKVFPTTDGSLASLALVRTRPVVGVAIGGRVPALANRLVLEGGESVARFVEKVSPSTRVIRYDAYKTIAPDPHAIAGRLATIHRLALALRDPDGTIGAIAPTAGSVLRIHHVGQLLSERPYTPKHIAALIAVDSDEVVPDERWQTIVHGAGLIERDYAPWELALVRALALAMAGQRPADLVGSGVVELDSEPGQLLCAAIVKAQDVGALLGPDLVRALRTVPLVRRLGSTTKLSVDDAAKLFPKRLIYVGADQVPVDDYAPLVATPDVAQLLGKLTGIEPADVTSELELRKIAAIRKRRVAEHRAQPIRELALPAGEISIQLEDDTSLRATGVVGIGQGALDIEVRIEGRAFTRIQRADDLPVRAIVELPLIVANAAFDGISREHADQLCTIVGRHAPPLLRAIAGTRAHLLGDLGAARTLLHAFLDTTSALSAKTRKALCKAPAFLTVQGERISLDDAAHPRNAISIAAWQGEWIARADDEEASAHDAPVLQVPATRGDLHLIFERLHAGAIVDVTTEVTKLQNQRRMARGLVPPPALYGVPAELRRKLAELGPPGKQLGPGEIGLVEERASIAFVHEAGLAKDRLTLDVQPPIAIALEAPDLLARSPVSAIPLDDSLDAQLRALRQRENLPGASTFDTRVQTLATLLVRRVLAAVPVEALPVAIRRNLRRALLAGRLEPEMLGDAAVFETTDGRWIGWAAVTAQAQRFGALWATAAPSRNRPLDDARVVLVLDAEEVALAQSRRSLSILDGAAELALDDQARRNMARPSVTSLDLPSRTNVFAEVTLHGDGTHAVFGIVGVLAPSASASRGVHPHRTLHPFDVVPDPCAWPTLAIVDDARFTPDRTWQHPVRDAVWQEAVTAIRVASERALASYGTAPDDALAELRLGPGVTDSLRSLQQTKRRPVIRGLVWLAGAPRTLQSHALEVFDDHGRFTFTPRGNVAIGGRVLVSAPEGWSREALLEELCEQAHGTMLRALARSPERDTDRGAAHLAYGLALGRIASATLSELRFECHRPDALTARELETMLRGDFAVRVLAVAEDGEGIVEDGSELARVVIACLGRRARRGPLPSIPAPAPSPRPATPTVPAPAPAPRAPDHPVQIVVEAVQARLSALGLPLPGFALEARSEPIARYATTLRLAADNPRLVAIANAMRARSPWAELAIDALAAHVLTVLDAALTSITEASEAQALHQLLQPR
ncbi:MAG TPA: hypothetical protein VFQ53_29085 [Kofleriaceae bacterium]|nr:hypothetical protein [Kofleriaceae bacterium]